MNGFPTAEQCASRYPPPSCPHEVLVWPEHLATNAFCLFLLCALFVLLWDEYRRRDKTDPTDS